MDPQALHPATVAAQALGLIDDASKGIVLPLHTSTTYIRDADNQYRSGRVYARDQNPTYDQAEQVLTALEGGHASLLFASGMAAATAVFQALAPGDRVVAPKVMYWSLRNWLANFATHWGLVVEFVDMGDPAAIERSVSASKTALLWIETPANPLWTITDLAHACAVAHAAGAVVAVDSTCATPVLTQPISFGADIVMHAATKYLNGHSDVVAGTLTTRADSPLWQRIRTVRAQIGGIAGPFEAWLLTRGMRTLFPRVKAACSSAHRRALRAPSARRGRALSGLAGVRGSRRRAEADARRLRRDAVALRPRDCDGERRGGSDRDRGERPRVEARDIARWRREPHRASRERRRRRHAGAREPAAIVGRDRGHVRPDRGSRAGALALDQAACK